MTLRSQDREDEAEGCSWKTRFVLVTTSKMSRAHVGPPSEAVDIPLDSAAVEDQVPATAAATSAIVPREITNVVKLKVASATLCFFCAGINDGSLGMLHPL